MKPIFCLALIREDGSVYIDSTAKSEVELTSRAACEGKSQVIRVKVAEHTKRSLPANSLIHLWSQTLSGFTGNDIIAQKQELKIKFGYPILLAANDDISIRLEWMFKQLGWEGLSWDRKVKLAELIPCTSLMDTKQLKQMMDNIKDWAISEFDIVLDNGKR